MGRLGLPLAELESFAEGVKRLPQVALEGVFSHLASSEVVDDEGTATRLSASTLRCARLQPMDYIRRFSTWPTVARLARGPIPGTTSCGPGSRFMATNSTVSQRRFAGDRYTGAAAETGSGVEDAYHRLA